jgi:deoxyadenosine/deoxycytidine kinase
MCDASDNTTPIHNHLFKIQETVLPNASLRFKREKLANFNHYWRIEGVVFDYDIFKSLIFAGVTLTEIDFKLFRDIYYFMTKDLYKPNLVIYLLQKTEKLLLNINSRGRVYEKDISKDYLDKINNAYLNYLKNRTDLNIVFIDISDYCTVIVFINNLIGSSLYII